MGPSSLCVASVHMPDEVNKDTGNSLRWPGVSADRLRTDGPLTAMVAYPFKVEEEL
jgi:hypothetical protein